MGRILGLDIGERRIGVAISDPDRRLAVPLRILERRGGAADAAKIAELARTEDIEALVVGHPVSLDGAVGAQARRVRALADRISQACGLPLELWDERLSSVQAERQPRSARTRKTPRGRRRRGAADDLAAAIILQGYLDHRRAAAAP